MTPEGKMKARVDKLLREHETYYLKPVQNGMGSPALDYHGVHRSQGFVIETKAPGKHPTVRQTVTMKKIAAAGGAVFLISTDSDLQELEAWLHLPVAEFVSTRAADSMNNSVSSMTPSDVE